MNTVLGNVLLLIFSDLLILRVFAKCSIESVLLYFWNLARVRPEKVNFLQNAYVFFCPTHKSNETNLSFFVLLCNF